MVKVMRKYSLIVVMLLTAFSLQAQEMMSWDQFMQQMTEDYADEEDETWMAEMELLNELHEHPFNINTASITDLQQLPFIDEQMAAAIVEYVTFNGEMHTLGELRLIRQLGIRERQWLQFFVYAAPVEQRRSISRWAGTQQELTTRADIPAYKREGWLWAQGIAHRMRFTWQQGKHIDAGLRIEKDAGEQLFTSDSPFYDSYGGHVMIKNLKWMQRMLVGDFKAGFGEGLVINNGLQFGKASTTLWRTTGGIRPHRSTDEAHFMRGIAGTLAFGQQWEVTAFFSYRTLDATVASDNTVRSINTTGLHRTESERRHRNTLHSQTTALHAQWKHKRWHAGITGMFQYYNHQFRQDNSLYRQIYPEGYLFGAVSADYGYQHGRFLVRGETARSFDIHGGGWATINKAAWRFNANTQLSVIQRFYSKDYYSPHASALGENSRVQNESGLTMQFDAERLGPFAVMVLADIFYSPWPRYSMTRYSTGWEGIMQTTWQPNNSYNLRLRYRVKSKEAYDRRYYSHQLRATYTYTFSPHWNTAFSGFLHRYHEPYDTRNAKEATSSNGFAIAPQVSYKSSDERWRSSLMFVWFHTDDWNSRLYLYEPSLYQTFGMAQLYGRGQRLIATGRWRSANKRWEVQTKVGVTHYTDRSEISSGILRIGSSWKADAQLLLRMKWGRGQK